MPLSKRAALGISLSVIVVNWIYNIATQTQPVLPAHFSELALGIAFVKLVVLAVIVLLLRLEGEGLAAIGVSRRGWPKHVGVGLIIGLAMFIGLNILLDTALRSLFPPPAGGPSIMMYFRQPANLLIWLLIGIFGGGVVEELQRIFIITRFEKALGRPGLLLGVVLSSAMFGFGHLYQGVGVAMGSAVSGLGFALVYLRRRSALEPVTAHAFSDVLAVVIATMIAGS